MCVKTLQEFHSQTEYVAFTTEPPSFRADQGPTFNGKQAYCQSNVNVILF